MDLAQGLSRGCSQAVGQGYDDRNGGWRSCAQAHLCDLAGGFISSPCGPFHGAAHDTTSPRIDDPNGHERDLHRSAVPVSLGTPEGKEFALVSMGSGNKALQTEWLNHRKRLSYGSTSWRSQTEMLAGGFLLGTVRENLFCASSLSSSGFLSLVFFGI